MDKVGTFFKKISLKSKNRENVILGKIKKSFFKDEYLTEAQLNHHVHIVGASGFGKTVLLSHIIKQRIEQNKGLLFVDLKADIETISKFKQYAECGRGTDLKIFSLTDESMSANYNVISSGTATQIRDKIMLSLIWSEEFYKNQAASFLLKMLIGLCWLRDHKNLNFDVATILKACNDVDFLCSLKSNFDVGIYSILQPFEEAAIFIQSSENYKSLQGLRSQLESLVYADFGSRLQNAEDGIDLYESVRSGKLVFIFLDSRRYGETAKTVGKFILQDLKMVSAKVDAEVQKSDRKPFTVIIDEFADLAQEDFIGFLDRARSSNMSVVIAHQEICDLLKVSPEFAGRLMGNTSTLYAFLQKRPESAEIISSMAGTRTSWKSTRQTERMWFLEVDSGKGSKREVEEFAIHPNAIKSLGVGSCVCVKKYPKAVAYKVKIYVN